MIVDLADDAAFLGAIVGFHKALSAASGNSVLDLLGLAILSMYERRLPASLKPYSERVVVVTEHAEIVNAIVSGEGAEAERLVAAHVGEVIALIEAQLPDLLDSIVDWE